MFNFTVLLSLLLNASSLRGRLVGRVQN
ncbi:leu operon leader peptide [Pectobacterium brasiliense]|uniref:leu operon leader peptide n=1 Tax=Pectobacterium brasiliense TaxID=180957 RepID=A0AAE2WGH9_9GAMM|nr:leu operon leader peptide [Pectobacterium brasiliense]MBN3052648.1 leu operon leader peptide [Pectobacterium brasiliense]MBN3070758.1 leu operon leader peptide [Pectobacterium brasiliense]MBN3169664.1 leu operon leader peptide [Pectobacterium brasiliense]